MPRDRYEIEKFLFHEARLMDESAYDDWLSLWTDTGIYWVPCNSDDGDPSRDLSIVYDDWTRLQDRIERLKSGAAYSQDPVSRMRRVISNVEFEEEEGGELVVYSNFILTELRRGKQDTFAGRTTHKLLPVDGGFKITYKKVVLVGNDEAIDNLAFLI